MTRRFKYTVGRCRCGIPTEFHCAGRSGTNMPSLLDREESLGFCTCSIIMTDGFVCCDGYIWNDILQACTECTPGFIGIGCSISCPYPLFGAKCIKTCFCPPENCNVSIGCTSTDRYTTVEHTRLFEEATITIVTEEKYRTKHRKWQHTTLSTTTAKQIQGETNQTLTNSSIFWGLFVSNGTILLLVATYIFFRFKKTCASPVRESKNTALTSAVNLNSAVSNRETSYVVSGEGGSISHYNQIYNEIDKSSSEGSSIYNHTIEILTDDNSRVFASNVYANEIKCEESETDQDAPSDRNSWENKGTGDVNELYLTVLSS